MITAGIYHMPITCSEPTSSNTNRRAREIAILVRDGALVWCHLCRLSHHIHKQSCLDVWDKEKGIVSWRITCDLVTHRNMAGREKLYATIDEIGIACWCKYCHAPHYITREQCLQMWD